MTGGLSATVLAFIVRPLLSHPFFATAPENNPSCLPFLQINQFPAICFLKLSDAPRYSGQKVLAWVCAGFGLVVMVLSFVLSLRKAIKGGGEALTCS